MEINEWNHERVDTESHTSVTIRLEIKINRFEWVVLNKKYLHLNQQYSMEAICVLRGCELLIVG